MKYYLAFMLFIGLILGQIDFNRFLNYPDKILDLKNQGIIAKELDELLEQYKSKINFDNYHKKTITDKVFVGEKFNKEAYLKTLKRMPNPKQSDIDHLKKVYTTKNYKTVEKVINKTFTIDETFNYKEPQWEEVVDFMGGYSKLAKKNITQNNIDLFRVETKLTKIEIVDSVNCIAYVEIHGNPDFAMKLHKIDKSNFEYQGTYKKIYNIDYESLIKKEDLRLKFFFSDSEISSFNNYEIVDDKHEFPLIDSYLPVIKLMFNDLVSFDEYISAFPELIMKEYSHKVTLKQALDVRYWQFSTIKDEYIELFGQNVFNEHHRWITVQKAKQNIKNEKNRIKNELEAKNISEPMSFSDCYCWLMLFGGLLQIFIDEVL